MDEHYESTEELKTFRTVERGYEDRINSHPKPADVVVSLRKCFLRC